MERNARLARADGANGHFYQHLIASGLERGTRHVIDLDAAVHGVEDACFHVFF
jgi:hypothetical protein